MYRMTQFVISFRVLNPGVYEICVKLNLNFRAKEGSPLT